MVVMEIVVPLATIVYLLARMRAVIYKAEAEEETAQEESTVYSKVTYERSVFKRKLLLVAGVVGGFYLVHVTTSLLSFGLEMNVGGVRNDWERYARLRGLCTVLLSMKCIIVPVLYMCLYDKLRNQLQHVLCRGGRKYTTLRYRVHKQSNENLTTEPVHEDEE
jgi:hypothetical protein